MQHKTPFDECTSALPNATSLQKTREFFGKFKILAKFKFSKSFFKQYVLNEMCFGNS